MDVDVISPDGKRFVLDHTELDQARSMGFKAMHDLLGASHMSNAPMESMVPSHTAPVQPEPSPLARVGRTLNNLGSSMAHGVTSGGGPLGWMMKGSVISPEALAQNEQYYKQAQAEQPTVATVGDIAGGAMAPDAVVAGQVGGGILGALGKAQRGGMEAKAFAKAVEGMGKSFDTGSSASYNTAGRIAKQALSPGQMVKDVAPAAGTAIGHHIGGLPGAYVGDALMGGSGGLFGPMRDIYKAIQSPALRYQLSRMALNPATGYVAGVGAEEGAF